MAFDKAYIYQNTSIIHDEVLAHRLGLIPVLVDPEHFIFKKGCPD
jgi:DNA-directed RNA polymerases I and III subunit RPAC1